MDFKTDKQCAVPSPAIELDKQLSKEEKVSLSVKVENVFWLIAKLVIFAAVLVGSLVLVGSYVCHMILPESMRWLNGIDLGHIQNFAIAVCSGAIASVMTNHYLNRK